MHFAVLVPAFWELRYCHYNSPVVLVWKVICVVVMMRDMTMEGILNGYNKVNGSSGE